MCAENNISGRGDNGNSNGNDTSHDNNNNSVQNTPTNNNQGLTEPVWNPLVWQSSRLDLTGGFYDFEESLIEPEVVYEIDEEALACLSEDLQHTYRSIYRERIQRLLETRGTVQIRACDYFDKVRYLITSESYQNSGSDPDANSPTAMLDALLNPNAPVGPQYPDQPDDTLFLGPRGPLRVMNPDLPEDEASVVEETGNEPNEVNEETASGGNENNPPVDNDEHANGNVSEGPRRPRSQTIAETLELLSFDKTDDGDQEAALEAARNIDQYKTVDDEKHSEEPVSAQCEELPVLEKNDHDEGASGSDRQAQN